MSGERVVQNLLLCRQASSAISAIESPNSRRIARLPVDLFRYELVMTLEPVSDAVRRDRRLDFLAAGAVVWSISRG
jgi:hypothetical protein